MVNDVVNDLGNASNEKVIQLLEEQLAYTKEQNKNLTKQIEALTEQISQLTKALYGSKSEKSKYQVPDGQGSLFEDDPSFNEPEQTEEQSTETFSYKVTRKKTNKKRNDSFHENIEIEEIHHYPPNLACDCCRGEMVEFSSTLIREEAKFIPASLKRVQHFEHVYECKTCKKNALLKAQIKRGKAPQGPIQRNIAGPTVLAKLIYDKFIQYLPLYRQVNEWERHDLHTNDKNLSNWVIRVAEDWLQPLYNLMNQLLNTKLLCMPGTPKNRIPFIMETRYVGCCFYAKMCCYFKREPILEDFCFSLLIRSFTMIYTPKLINIAIDVLLLVT